MQYVWQFRLWPTADMVTVDGERIEVLDPGVLNTDAGPDFFNAKVMIGGQLWIGNVEIHIRASDWMRHGHATDPAYDSVVLHVVERDDAPVYRSDGQKIPQMVMTCAADFSQRYHQMVNNPARELPCAPELGAVPGLCVSDWVTALGFERMQAKADRVLDMLERSNGSWANAIYVTAARALGFGVNAEPFELLALTTPLRDMLRHSDSSLALEAMLFGQAGMLGEGAAEDGDYPARLADEYRFMAAKYGLAPSPNIMWKMARMRPQNSPHRRIAALAAMVRGGFAMGSRLLAVESEADARALFDISLSGFWAQHYNFTAAGAGARAFSQSSISVLIINVAVPVLYAYGTFVNDRRRQELAVDLLQSLKPERNSITDIFERAGLKIADAFASQAFIQLRKEYCLPRKCLYCRIGHKLLSAKAKR